MKTEFAVMYVKIMTRWRMTTMKENYNKSTVSRVSTVHKSTYKHFLLLPVPHLSFHMRLRTIFAFYAIKVSLYTKTNVFGSMQLIGFDFILHVNRKSARAISHTELLLTMKVLSLKRALGRARACSSLCSSILFIAHSRLGFLFCQLWITCKCVVGNFFFYCCRNRCSIDNSSLFHCFIQLKIHFNTACNLFRSLFLPYFMFLAIIRLQSFQFELVWCVEWFLQSSHVPLLKMSKGELFFLNF